MKNVWIWDEIRNTCEVYYGQKVRRLHHVNIQKVVVVGKSLVKDLVPCTSAVEIHRLQLLRIKE